MKRSLLFTLLILALGSGWHVLNLRGLEAARAGLQGANPGPAPLPVESGARGREIARARLATPESAQFNRDLQTLDLDGLLACLAELQKSGNMESDPTLYAVAAVLEAIIDRNPQAALAQLAKERAPGITRQMQARYAPEALDRWAKREPEKAAAWLDATLAGDAETFGKETLRSLGKTLAGEDAALAISALRKHLGPEEIVAITGSARGLSGPQEKDFMASREFVAALPEGGLKSQLEQRIYRSLSQAIEAGKFETIAPWLERTRPGTAELEAFASGLTPHELGSDSGKWMAWIGDRLGTDAIRPQVTNLMQSWASADPLTAGTWLTSAADNAAKIPAVQAFAGTVAPFQPQIAEQWALVLPEGEERKLTLQSIYDYWPRSDAEARESFRQRYGLR